MLNFVSSENFNWFEKLLCLNSRSGRQEVFYRKLVYDLQKWFYEKTYAGVTFLM